MIVTGCCSSVCSANSSSVFSSAFCKNHTRQQLHRCFSYSYNFLVILVVSIAVSLAQPNGVKVYDANEGNPPDFSFSLSEPNSKCKCSPDPARVQSARYYLIECAYDVSKVDLQFDGVRQVYDSQGNVISSLRFQPKRNHISTQYVQIRSNRSSTSRSTSDDNPQQQQQQQKVDSKTDFVEIQIDVSRSDLNNPVLASDGIVFTNYAGETLTLLDPSKLVYSVQLYAGEPTIVAAKAAPGFFVSFSNNESTQNSFVERSAVMELIPEGSVGDTFDFQIHVTNPSHSAITTYTVAAKLVRSINPLLRSAEVHPGRLDPPFKSNQYTYFYRVPESATSARLSVTAINVRYTRCFLQTFSNFRQNDRLIVSPEKAVKSKASEMLYSTTASGQIALGGAAGDSTYINLSPGLSPTSIVVDCVGADDTYKIRYTFAVVRQCGGSTLLENLEIPFVPFERLFNPAVANVYRANVDRLSRAKAKWINFHVVPSNPRAICKVDDQSVDPSTHMSPFFRLLPGEKRRFRVSVRTPENTVEEEYIIEINRAANWWFQKASVIANIGDKTACWSAVISATQAINFINNVKFLQFVSLTNRLSGTPESYDIYSKPFNKWNLQWDFPYSVYLMVNHNHNPQQFSSNRNDSSSMVVEPVPNFPQARMLNADDTKAELENTVGGADTKAGFLSAGARVGSWESMIKQVASNVKMYKASSFEKPDSDWVAAHPDSRLFEYAVSKVLSHYASNRDQKQTKSAEEKKLGSVGRFDNSKSDAVGANDEFANVGEGLRRMLSPASEKERDEIMQQLDFEYKTQEKLLNFCSSIFVTISLFSAALIAYSVLWFFHLRDVNKDSWFSLRQDFPAVLKPTRFWTFLFDFALISLLQSCCGILFSTGKNDVVIYLFGFSTTPAKMAWLAACTLIFLPISFLVLGSLILQRIQQNLVFSKSMQSYHDSVCNEVKASLRFFSWVPIVSNIFSIEISSVAPVSSCSTESKDVSDNRRKGGLVFVEDSPADAPCLMLSSDPSNTCSVELCNMVRDVESTQHEPLLNGDSSASSVDYRADDETVKVSLLSAVAAAAGDVAAAAAASASKRNTVDSSSFLCRYPNACVGYSEYRCAKNASDILMNVKVEVQLRHLPSLMKLKSFDLWVPRSNLQFNEVDNWNLLFGKSQKGNLLYWMIDRCMTAGIVFYLSCWSEKRGIAQTAVFTFAYLLTICSFWRPAVSSGLSRFWRRQQQKEQEKKRQQEGDLNPEPKPYPYNDESYFEWQRQKRSNEENSYIEIIGNYVMHNIWNSEVWNSRLWVTICECFNGSIGFETLKFSILLNLLLGNHSIGLYNDSFVLVNGIFITIVSLVCLNKEGLHDWWKQLRVAFDETVFFLYYCSVKLLDFATDVHSIVPKSKHYIVSTLRWFSGERGVSFAYSADCYMKVRTFKVNEASVINNEMGVFLHGKITPPSSQTSIDKISGSEESEVTYKTLYVNGVAESKRADVYRSMPIQMPFKQFLQKGKRKSGVMNRLIATIQISNYNDSRGFTSTYSHSPSEDDSFYSLYCDSELLPAYGQIGPSPKRHGYVVRWLFGEKKILIRGPYIEADHEYSVITKTSYSSNDVDEDYDEDDYDKNNSKKHIVASWCLKSGVLEIVEDLEFEAAGAPDLNHKITVKRVEDEKVIVIDPTKRRVVCEHYKVSRTCKRKLVLYSSELIAHNKYSVCWEVAAKAIDVRERSKSPANGILYIDWKDSQPPNLSEILCIKDETPGRVTEVYFEVDPTFTDAHQFVFLGGQKSGVPSLVSEVIAEATRFKNAVIGVNPVKHCHEEEPIPCTVVQCVDLPQKLYRIEPNFNEAVKRVNAKIEHRKGMKRDLETTEGLSNLWMDFMTEAEFVSFCQSMGIDVLREPSLIVSRIFSGESVFFPGDQATQHQHEFKDKLRGKLEELIDSDISVLRSLAERYNAWHRCYISDDLYACQSSIDSYECKSKLSESNRKAIYEEQKRQQQHHCNDLILQLTRKYKAVLHDVVYPMTIHGHLISKRDRLESQMEMFSEELRAWLLLESNYSLLKYDVKPKRANKAVEAVTEAAMRAIKLSINKQPRRQQPPGTILHYIISSGAIRGNDRNWKPDPLGAHYCKVRLFAGYKEDKQKVDFTRQFWIPCYLKLTTRSIIIYFPTDHHHNNDDNDGLDDNDNDNLDTSSSPSYYSEEASKRWLWNRCRGFFIPLECFELMLLSIDSSASASKSSFVSEETEQMHCQLVLPKNATVKLRDDYIQKLSKHEECDELNYRLDNSSSSSAAASELLLKLRLSDGRDTPASRLSSALTFRFHKCFFNKWQSAIQMAQMDKPRTPPLPDGFFDHVVKSNSDRDPSSGSITGTDTVIGTVTDAGDPRSPRTPEDSPSKFVDWRFTDNDVELKDSVGNTFYKGEIAEGQRWGFGECEFKDHENRDWRFKGRFVADEMHEGTATLIDEAELSRLRNSSSSADRYRITSYTGVLSLPRSLRSSVAGQSKKADILRMNSNAALRMKPSIHPSYMKFDHQTAGDDYDDVIMDLRRCFSACADDDTAKASTALVQDNFGKLKATYIDRKDSSASIDSSISIDGEGACLEQLPHRSKWTRLLDPRCGYQRIADRFMKGEVTFADGSRYRGGFKYGVPNGYGKYRCNVCGLVYEGYWIAGRPEGNGCCLMEKEGLQYTGGFKAGKREGEGTQMALNRKIAIKGYFDDDALSRAEITLEGEAVKHCDCDWKTYIGDVDEDGLFSSSSSFLEWTDGSQYRGMFDRGLRNGAGEIVDPHKQTIFSGRWKDDVPSGRVKALECENSHVYMGFIVRGQRQGLGQLTRDDGSLVYDGEWMNDLPEGKGELHVADGYYEGRFKEGKRHGKGLFQLNSSSSSSNGTDSNKKRVYEGDWVDDKPDGVGRYRNEDGAEKTHKFKCGVCASSAKQHKTGLCGNSPVAKPDFHVEPCSIPSQIPVYWGTGRTMNVERQKAICNLGSSVWEKHENERFEFVEPDKALLLPADTLGFDPEPLVLHQSFSSSQFDGSNGVLEVHVKDAVNLKLPKEVGWSPVCRVMVNGRVLKTPRATLGGGNPRWDKTLKFPKAGAEFIRIRVGAQHPFIGHCETIGEGNVSIKEFIESNSSEEKSVKVHLADGAGTVNLVLSTIEGTDAFVRSMSSRQERFKQATPRFVVAKVHSVRDLYSTDAAGAVSPYLQYQLGGKTVESDVRGNGGKTCEMNFENRMAYNKESEMTIQVWDDNQHDDEAGFVGEATITFDKFQSGDVYLSRFDPIKGEVPAGVVRLTVGLAD